MEKTSQWWRIKTATPLWPEQNLQETGSQFCSYSDQYNSFLGGIFLHKRL